MDKNKNMEKIEKVAQSLDKGIKMADEKLSEVPKLAGDHKPKMIVGLVLLLIIALFRDSNLVLVGLVITAILYASEILAFVKKQMEKKQLKSESTTESVEKIEDKKE